MPRVPKEVKERAFRIKESARLLKEGKVLEAKQVLDDKSFIEIPTPCLRSYKGVKQCPTQDYAKAKWIAENFKVGDFLLTEVKNIREFKEYLKLLSPYPNFYTIFSVSAIYDGKIKITKIREEVFVKSKPEVVEEPLNYLGGNVLTGEQNF